MPVTSRVLACALLVLGCAAPGASLAQAGIPVLIISQRQTKQSHQSFVDFGLLLARDLKDAGGYEPIVYSRSLEAIRNALNGNQLTAADLTEPLTPAAAHKVAHVLGMGRVLFLAGENTKDGMSAHAQMERVTGQDTWTLVFSQDCQPFKPTGKRANVFEAIKNHSAIIVNLITGAPVKPIDQGAPVSVPLDKPKPGRNQGKPPAGPSRGAPNLHPDPPAEGPKPETARPADNPPSNGGRPAAMPVPSANEILVDRFRKQGDLANLILALRRAVTDKPRDAKLRRELARAYLDRGWQSAARDEAARAVALAPQDAALHRVLGDIELQGNEAEAALAEYQAAVKLGPNDAANHVALGDAYWNLGKVEETVRAYAAAAEADPKSSLPHRKLARVHAQAGRFAEARRELNVAKDMAPADDVNALNADFGAVLQVSESSLREVLGRLQAIRKAMLEGARNREQSFGDADTQRKRAEEIVGFLEAMPAPPALSRIQGMYAQAATFVVQSAEASVQFILSGNTQRDEEYALQRVEADKQMKEAATRLKALLARDGA